jgi:Nnf1
VDILHQVVTEARARRQRGETVSAAGSSTGADTWRADLQPRAAVRARTLPALERERDSLRARLAEVRFIFSVMPPPLPHPPSV